MSSSCSYIEQVVLDQENVDKVCDTTHDSQTNEGRKCHSAGNRTTRVSGNKIESPTGISPCINKYPGTFDFQVQLSEASKSRKSWVYSSKLGKVFVDANKILLFQFKLNAKSISNMRIRALLVYVTPDHNHQPVNRCMLHALKCDPNYLSHSQNNICNCNNSKLAGHVLTSNHTNAEYEYNTESGRHSVIVPLVEPQVGSESILIGYQFGCKTSCEGGMSRRTVNLVFTLETEQGQVLGRSVMLVKVCCCPKRDKDREESDDVIVIPDSSNESLRGTKRKIENSLEHLAQDPKDSSRLKSNITFISIFNQIEQMTELMRRSVEAQKKQFEDALQSQEEIMSAIEELTCKITEFISATYQERDES